MPKIAKQLLFATSLIGIALIPVLMLPADSQVTPRLVAGADAGLEQNGRMPIRLTIPRIGVDAFVEYMGITSDGAMDTPTGPDTVGWFNLGPRPGEVGSAVIDGHFGWKNGVSAVFDHLSELQKGDLLYVEDGMGTTTIFIVREKRLYNPQTEAPSVFISSDGKAHLNLVTCEGVWDAVSKSYSGRLVIFADKE